MDAHERTRILELAQATRDKLRGKLAGGRYEDEALRQMARLQIEALTEVVREAGQEFDEGERLASTEAIFRASGRIV